MVQLTQSLTSMHIDFLRTDTGETCTGGIWISLPLCVCVCVKPLRPHTPFMRTVDIEHDAESN